MAKKTIIRTKNIHYLITWALACKVTIFWGISRSHGRQCNSNILNTIGNIIAELYIRNEGNKSDVCTFTKIRGYANHCGNRSLKEI